MAKQLDLELRYSTTLLENLGKHSNFNVRHCKTEILDNGKSATKNVGLVNVQIATLSSPLPNGASMIFTDYGCGMDKEELQEYFFTCGKGNFNKEVEAHANIGARIAISRVCSEPDSYVTILTKKNGCQPIKVMWDGKGKPFAEELDDETIPVGTTISFYNIKDDEPVWRYISYCSMRYCYAIENGLSIKINGETVIPENPLYPEYKSSDKESQIFKKEITVIGPKDGKEYVCEYYIRNMSSFYDSNGDPVEGLTPHAWDVNESGKFILNTIERSGLWLQIGDTIITEGGKTTPYIERTTHNQMIGIRVLLKIPVGLAYQLGFQLNKSQGFASFNHPTLKELKRNLRNDFEDAIQNSVRKRNETNKAIVNALCDKKIVSGAQKEVEFTMYSDNSLPNSMFVILDKNGSVKFNQKSPLLKGLETDVKKLPILLNVVEEMYVAIEESLAIAKKHQCAYKLETHPKSVSTSARDETIQVFRDAFYERFKMLGSKK